MRNVKKKYLLILATVLLASCKTTPNETAINDADYGLFVNSAECVEVARNFLLASFKDPESARFGATSCSKGWQEGNLLAGFSSTFGYEFIIQANAKNSFGAYGGMKLYSGIVRDDGQGPRVVRFCTLGTNLACFPSYLEGY